MTQSRTLRTLVLSTLAATTLAATTLAGAALAEERTYLTPPLYREQARVTAAVRPASELTTTPSVTARAAPEARRVVAEVSEASDR